MFSIRKIRPLLFIFQKVVGVIIGKSDSRGFPDRKSWLHYIFPGFILLNLFFNSLFF